MFKDLKKNFYELLDEKKSESNEIIKNKDVIIVSKKKTLKLKK